MSFRSRPRAVRCALVLVAALLPQFTAGLALAQTSPSAAATNPGYQERMTRDGRGVIFDDDLASAGGPAGGTAMFVPTRAAARALLLQPRFQFVSEMLKSVENL